MTDEAPTAADVQALIARLNKDADAWDRSIFNSEDGTSKLERKAAAALAAQAQRIAMLEAEYAHVHALAKRSTERMAELAKPGSIGAFAARDAAIARANIAEAALRQAVPREPDVGMETTGYRVCQHYADADSRPSATQIWLAMHDDWTKRHDAAPAAPGEKP